MEKIKTQNISISEISETLNNKISLLRNNLAILLSIDLSIIEAIKFNDELYLTKENLNKEIIKLKEEVDSLSNLARQKKELEDEIEQKSVELNKVRISVDNTNNEFSNKLKEIEGKIYIEQNKLDEIIKKNRIESEIILPSLVEIQKREKNVEKKENDLKVIEQRFIRLYQEKGVPLKMI